MLHAVVEYSNSNLKIQHLPNLEYAFLFFWIFYNAKHTYFRPSDLEAFEKDDDDQIMMMTILLRMVSWTLKRQRSKKNEISHKHVKRTAVHTLKFSILARSHIRNINLSFILDVFSFVFLPVPNSTLFSSTWWRHTYVKW